MWLKTAIRAIAKRLPLSAELLSEIERNDEPTQFDHMRAEAMAQLGAQPVGVLEEQEPMIDDHADHGSTPHDDDTFPGDRT
jgi:hypothetical protein